MYNIKVLLNLKELCGQINYEKEKIGLKNIKIKINVTNIQQEEMGWYRYQKTIRLYDLRDSTFCHYCYSV